ncbi:partner of SLD five protein, putative [Medicago truncatula]|uniref:Partner of SLD five protein, putative n=1 Tax=Medicago truncatula TaxID=3880 RepID=G7KY30_MEDTR|nr:partner of SLD five protein, putative [Medicago truncatula]
MKDSEWRRQRVQGLRGPVYISLTLIISIKACELVKEFATGKKGQLRHHLRKKDWMSKRLEMYNKAETTRNLLWKIGPLLPKEIEEKLNHWEEDYFKKHSDIVPPKDSYFQVRVLEDIREGIVLSDDKNPNFARHSIQFLKRNDAEKYISRATVL